jgi:hypothetical protein
VTEANALIAKRDMTQATAALTDALAAARAIGSAPLRDANVQRIEKLLETAKAH